MKKKCSILLVISILSYYSFVQTINLNANIEDAIEEQVNEIELKSNSSKSLNLFNEHSLQNMIEAVEELLDGIKFDDLMKQIDKKKVFYPPPQEEEETFLLNSLITQKSYQLLCLGNISLPVEIQSKLKCRYIDRGVPFLKIAPFKEEEAYLEPRIVIFHDIIYPGEIETFKKLAQPKLQRATFINEFTGEEETKKYRTTDTAWLDIYEHQDVLSLYKRVHLMTGLTLKTAEWLQIAYYPLNGKYEPHFDMETNYPRSKYSPPHFYDRIATVLFYLNNVQEGGATVFPKLDVSLTPKKGSAAFWYNFKLNGNRDYLTKHAACPVTSGIKWAANLWISEAWQEFHRPCTLDNQPRDEEWELLYLPEEDYEYLAQNMTSDFSNMCENKLFFNEYYK